MRYAFIQAHEQAYPVRTLCRVLKVERSGYYAWRKTPLSQRAIEDERVLGLIKHAWLASGTSYGYRKVYDDLREQGESAGRNRVGRIMSAAGIHARIGYRKGPYKHGGKPAEIAPNVVNREFDVDAPDTVWVTDFTYIRTYEGWIFLAVIMDLFSRRIVGWSMRKDMAEDLVLDALVMALWRRKPKRGLVLHSDQGSQYTGRDWLSLAKDHGIVVSMSRRGNCLDNAVAESFFSLLKKERIKQRVYPTRDAARSDVFDYVEMFYNPVRKHGSNGLLSPVEYERRFLVSKGSV